ncbi:fumarylacetoacetate hydrolase family protein [Kitasatospora purpeofusca]|uniref:fumarylacetoacetate hydrolase family protein n=1 Tax=Kitasatospora purpeofusca TaxID=67352 RepID=UPI000B2F8C2E|nr:fumarylacetoacetate hydrolase family protein [Kitasatospora purpeofusca]MCX4687869.1 fumarylacetoacetate hydrolase family protein [Kitasatospora purpeofusca]MCX4755029.1 fumarylacetoacetate hydrolase family protein [Kitasatospora purpeofusca]WSR34402.1 fumarylacetoacetate hydrolase family protein [Kitasatospora purpeofusca]WSR42627.1 fumarylacetoacetate hydrolase family protein [Kitasatospora purpeofusca]
MRIARFSVREGSPAAGSVSFGVVEGDPARPESLVVHALAGHPFGQPRPTGESYRFQDVRLLSPILPNKIVAVGRNYAAHAAELGNAVPDVPLTFFKPSTSVIGPTENIAYPPFSSDVQHEAELAVVIGRMCREVPLERVPEVILGYTCANDVTARDVQQREGQWARAKGFDTACPLGPWIETDLDPSDLAITCTVNGELRQTGRTSLMVRSVAELIVHISEAMTLLPGDVVLTGTPAGVGPIQVGDEVAVTVEGIGTLANKVVKRG